MLNRRTGVVWGLWALMLIVALLYIFRFAANSPFYDEWGMVRVLDGTESVNLSWLWAPNNDHRIPIPRLLMLSFYRAGGWDFRVAMVVNALLMAASAALLMRAVAANRGKTIYADAFFPALLLGWGHFENLLWGWQITQVFAVFLVLALLAVITRSGLRPAPTTALTSALAVVALPLSGVPGLVYAPGLAIWLACVGILFLQDGKKVVAAVLWVCGALTLVLVPLYFLNLTTTVRESTNTNLQQIIITMVRFLSQGLGPATTSFRPASYFFTLFLGLYSFVLVTSTLRIRSPIVRGRSVALLLYLLGIIGLGLSVGVARPGIPYFPGRYFLLASPALAWVYCSWNTTQHGRFVSLMRTVLAFATIGSLAINYPAGLSYGQERAGGFAAFTKDLQAGAPPSLLISRHQRALFPFPEEGGSSFHTGLGNAFEKLRQYKIGVFADLAQENSFDVIPISEKARFNATDSSGIWSFEPSLCVAGLLIEPAQPILDSPTPGADPDLLLFKIEWQSGSSSYSRDRSYVHLPKVGEVQREVWIYDEISSLRLDVDDPGRTFAPPALRLLLANEDVCLSRLP